MIYGLLILYASALLAQEVKRVALSFLLRHYRASAESPSFTQLQHHPDLAMTVLQSLKDFTLPPDAQHDGQGSRTQGKEEGGEGDKGKGKEGEVGKTEQEEVAASD